MKRERPVITFDALPERRERPLVKFAPLPERRERPVLKFAEAPQRGVIDLWSLPGVSKGGGQ